MQTEMKACYEVEYQLSAEKEKWERKLEAQQRAADTEKVPSNKVLRYNLKNKRKLLILREQLK